MALPVDFREFTPKDARNDLLRRLEQAPQEHVEALLSTYELLQRMHDKGLIDVANGLLSASDTVVERCADMVRSREGVNGIRVTFMLINLLSALDVDRMHALLSGSDSQPPSMLKLGRDAMSSDARRGMAAAVGLLNVFGSALRKQTGESRPTAKPHASFWKSLTSRFYDDLVR
jgi:uncharacterized protein YjgD (DUF1641 family)